MAYSAQVYGVISQVADKIYERQDAKKEKSNTLVTAIGALITAVVSALTFLLESDVEGLPTWTPLVVMVLGLAGTVFGVSRTKNGITKSVIQQLNDGVADLIQDQERDGGAVGIPETAVPTVLVEEDSGSSVVPVGDSVIDRAASELEALAQRLAQRKG